MAMAIVNGDPLPLIETKKSFKGITPERLIKDSKILDLVNKNLKVVDKDFVFYTLDELKTFPPERLEWLMHLANATKIEMCTTLKEWFTKLGLLEYKKTKDKAKEKKK